jgi:hypothetical protein
LGDIRDVKCIIMKLLGLQKCGFKRQTGLQNRVKYRAVLGMEINNPLLQRMAEFLDQLCDYQLHKCCDSLKWLQYTGGENQQVVENLLKGHISHYVLYALYFKRNVKVKLSLWLIN